MISKTEASDAQPIRPAAVVILAAGKGTRMRSDLPKVLHPVAGAPMLAHTMRAARALSAARTVVVVGHGGDEVAVAAAAVDPAVEIAWQTEQRGTAHAVAQARAALDGFDGDVFVLYADTPLLTEAELKPMAAARATGAGVVVLGFETDAPGAYGRLITDDAGALLRIVEAADATPEERAVGFCNSGVMCVDGARLFTWLDRVDDDNAKGEFYLTDLVAIARADGAACAAVACDETAVMGVNSRVELAAAEAAYQATARRRAMLEGATLTAPETVYFAHDTALGRDVTIEPHVVFGPGVAVESGAVIRAFSHLEGCRIGRGASVGPYVRLRPGAEIGENVRVGNYVEVKNATIGDGAKVPHLSYVGDASVGAGANVGAGAITCNYDGYLKHRTEIAEDAFIGTNVALVAPVSIGARAIVGAGSTITENVPDDALAVGRGRQATKPGLGRMLRNKLAAAKAALKAR